MRLPYGISDYATLINRNYNFIDKTPYIEQIENSHKRIIQPGLYQV